MVKAALYPPALPTLIRKSRLLRLIFEPPYIFPNGHVPAILDGRIGIFRIAVDVEQRSAMAAPDAL
jgi:hypothetical protein